MQVPKGETKNQTARTGKATTRDSNHRQIYRRQVYGRWPKYSTTTESTAETGRRWPKYSTSTKSAATKSARARGRAPSTSTDRSAVSYLTTGTAASNE